MWGAQITRGPAWRPLSFDLLSEGLVGLGGRRGRIVSRLAARRCACLIAPKKSISGHDRGGLRSIAGFGGGAMSPELNVTPTLVRTLVKQMKTFREACGDDIGLKLDLNYNFKTDGFIAIAKALTPEALVRATRAARVARASPAITMRAAPPTMSHPPVGATIGYQACGYTPVTSPVPTSPSALRQPPSPAAIHRRRCQHGHLHRRLHLGTRFGACAHAFAAEPCSHACTWDSGK